MPRMICVECGEELEPVRNGVIVKLPNYVGCFHADLYECPKCHKQILINFGKEIVPCPYKHFDFDYTGGGPKGRLAKYLYTIIKE